MTTKVLFFYSETQYGMSLSSNKVDGCPFTEMRVLPTTSPNTPFSTHPDMVLIKVVELDREFEDIMMDVYPDLSAKGVSVTFR